MRLGLLLVTAVFIQLPLPLSSAWGAKDRPLFVQAEIELDKVLYRHVLRRKDGKIEVGLNNNLLCGHFKESRIGTFRIENTKDYSPLLGAFDKISDRFDGSSNPLSRSKDRHRLNWLIGDREVSGNRGYSNLVRQALEQTCLENRIQPLRMVSGELRQGLVLLTYYENGKKIRTQKSSLNDLKCSIEARSRLTRSVLYSCGIPAYGRLSLLEEKK